MADAWTPPRAAIRRARGEIEGRIAERLRREGPGGFVAASQPAPPEAVEAQADPQRRLGRYTLVRQIGRGGMAAVWKSWDRDLGRWVAVKVLHDEGAQAHWPRFVREAQATARLRHPNLVMVHDAGEFEGRQYLVMELIEGKPLDVRAPRDQVVAAIAKVAMGLEEAHRNGIVHRDVKPGNIMVDEKGEPHVVDFGLVHLVDDDHLRLTRTGATVGTPIYMAPEQVSSRAGGIGHATDVYALGVILYEVLAGRPPHAGGSATEVYGRILSDDPVAPRKLNAGAPRDLETIALKALEKDPVRRYPSAGAMAEDLRRYLAGEPVLARRSWFLHRWRRWISRRRGAAMITASLLAALIASSVILSRQLSSSRRTVELLGSVSNLLNRAETLTRQGAKDQAKMRLLEGEAVCRGFLEGSDFPHARYFLGRFLRELGRDDDADRELTRALDLDPGLGEARLERGVLRVGVYWARLRVERLAALHEGGDVPPAEEVERTHPELRSLREAAIADLSASFGRSSYFRDEDARYGKAELARVKGDAEKARNELQRILEADRSYAPAHFSLALIAESGDNPGKAIEHLSNAIDCNRGYTQAWLTRCLARHQRTRGVPPSDQTRAWLKESLEDAEQALKLGDRNIEAYASRGDVRRRMGDRTGAIEDYLEAIRLNPSSPILWLNLGNIRRETGDFPGAIRDLDEALERNPRLGAAFTDRALTRLRMGDPDRAIADFNSAIEISPKNSTAWNNLGRLQIDRGELDAALHSLNQAVQHSPYPVHPLINRAHAHNRRGEFDLAIADCNDVIKLDPRNAPAFFGRGNAWLRKDNRDKAVADYSAAIERNAAYEEAWANRGIIHYTRYGELIARGSRDEAALEGGLAKVDFEEALRLGLPDDDGRRKIESALEQLKRELPDDH